MAKNISRREFLDSMGLAVGAAAEDDPVAVAFLQRREFERAAHQQDLFFPQRLRFLAASAEGGRARFRNGRRFSVELSERLPSLLPAGTGGPGTGGSPRSGAAGRRDATRARAGRRARRGPGSQKGRSERDRSRRPW